MKKREPYVNCKSKSYDDLKGYFCGEVSFSINDSKDDIKIKEIQKISRVWLLFAKNENDEYVCLQVAQSKTAEKEVEAAVIDIFSKISLNYSKMEFTNSTFYEGVCPKKCNGYSYHKLLYSMIGSKYKEFKSCYLDVDSYLNLCQEKGKNVEINRIVDICKNQYAEALIAFQTQAVYWRAYSSGVDGQTLVYINEHI